VRHAFGAVLANRAKSRNTDLERPVYFKIDPTACGQAYRRGCAQSLTTKMPLPASEASVEPKSNLTLGQKPACHDRCSDRSPLHDVRHHAPARSCDQAGAKLVLRTNLRAPDSKPDSTLDDAPEMTRARWRTSRSDCPGWWSQTGSNRRPPACKAGALPTELWPQAGGSQPAKPEACKQRIRNSE
jgi:hypothetical protein